VAALIRNSRASSQRSMPQADEKTARCRTRQRRPAAIRWISPMSLLIRDMMSPAGPAGAPAATGGADAGI
jgi:hypothetical protein